MKQILVVDDLAIFREPIEAVLRTAGYDVLTAANGAEALSVLSTKRADLVILDLEMPVMDGLTTLAHMRQQRAMKCTRVVVLSSESDKSRIMEAVKLGISGYVLKNAFSVELLLDRVAKAIGDKDSAVASGVATLRADIPCEDETAQPQPDSDDSQPRSAPGTAEIAHSIHSSPAGDDVSQNRPPVSVDPKSLKPLMSRSALLERINSGDELTAFSPTVSQVLRVTSSEKCTMDQVAKAVSQDHAIALKILKLANSSIYSLGDRVDTVHKAVLRIGVQSLRQAVLNISVVDRFRSIAFEKHLNTPLFWEHSIACGIIGASLAHLLGHKEPDTAFTAGLLHDLGRIIYAERLGADYIGVLDTAAATQLPLELVEARLLLLTHAEVMNRFLSAWHFPKDLASPIAFHHAEAKDVRSLAPNQAIDTLRLALANRLAHAMMLGSSGNDTLYPTTDHCRLLNVTPGMIASIESGARQQTDDTKFALLSCSDTGSWPRRVDQLRATLNVPFQPLFIGMTPELDAYRIFCQSLSDPADTGRPTVAVVHVASPKERDALAKQLEQAESKMEATRIPLLALTPDGHMPPNFPTANRSHAALPTPTPISMFIDAIRSLNGAATCRQAA